MDKLTRLYRRTGGRARFQLRTAGGRLIRWAEHVEAIESSLCGGRGRELYRYAGDGLWLCRRAP